MAGITATAEQVIAQLKMSRGNISHAAGKLNTHRFTLHRYINEHLTVKAALHDIKEASKDRAETMLEKRMETSDTLLIFYLKTQAYDRGYGDKSQISGPNGGPLQMAIVKGYAMVTPDEWDKDQSTTDSNL